MKTTLRLLLAICLLGLLTSTAARAGTTFALYVKDKTVKTDEAISHVPQALLSNVIFPIRMAGKTIVCELWVNDKAKEKTVVVCLRDPSIAATSDKAATIFSGTFPYSEKKTQVFDSDAYAISFKITPGDAAPAAGQ